MITFNRCNKSAWILQKRSKIFLDFIAKLIDSLERRLNLIWKYWISIYLFNVMVRFIHSRYSKFFKCLSRKCCLLWTLECDLLKIFVSLMRITEIVKFLKIDNFFFLFIFCIGFAECILMTQINIFHGIVNKYTCVWNGKHVCWM